MTLLAVRNIGRFTLASLSGIALVVMTGCGIGNPAVSSGTALPAVKGVIHGGQTPIQGATVTLFRTDPTATTYGAPGIYVGSSLTDAGGNFTMAPSAGPVNCPAGTQAYIVSTGGYQTGHPELANTSAVLMAALGDCSTISGSTFVIIDEVTTVAAAYALSGFTTTNFNTAVSRYEVNISAPAGNSAAAGAATATTPSGLVHAFQNAALLADYTTGLPRGTVNASLNGTTVTGSVPYVELLTLADTMQACVDGATGNDKCTTLFSLTPSLSGAAPVNTLQAFVNLARNPYPSASAMSGLLALATPTSAFQPTLTAAPIDWSISIVYGKGTLPAPYYVALDANDTVYFGQSTTSNTTPAIYGLSTYGMTVPSFASPSSFAATPTTRMLAPDALGNIWVANNNSVTDRFSTASGALVGSYTSTLGSTASLAVDRANNLWAGHVASGTGFNIEGLVYNATTQTWAQGYTVAPGSNTGSYGLMIDANQNIWSAGYFNSGTSVVMVPNSGTATVPSYTGTTTNGVTAIGSLVGTVGSLPYSVVSDPSGNAWVGFAGSNTTATTGLQQVKPNALLGATSLSVQTAILGTTAGTNGNVLGTRAVNEIAIDGAGTIFVPDSFLNTQGIHMYSTVTGNTLTPATGLKSCYLATTSTTACATTTNAALYFSRQPAVDSTGSVWVALNTGGVTQVIGVAAPSYPLLSTGRPSQAAGLTTVSPLP